MDRHRDRLAPLPRGHQGSEQTAFTPFQKLDLSLGSLVLCYPQFVPRASAGLEQLQSVLQRSDFCQLLRGVTHHAPDVFGMESLEAHKNRQITRDGSGDRHVSSGEARSSA